jgi:hypothetical protein
MKHYIGMNLRNVKCEKLNWIDLNHEKSMWLLLINNALIPSATKEINFLNTGKPS